MLKTRAAQSVGGPDGQSTWQALNETALVAAQGTLGQTPVVTPLMIVGGPSSSIAGGLPNPDVLGSGASIASLRGGVVHNLAATLVATAALGLTLAVYRAGVIVGGGPAFGWLASGTISPTIAGATVVLGGGAGAPQLAQLTAVTLPALAANTALVSPNGTTPYLPLLPQDLIVAIAVAQTGTVAQPLLALMAGVV